jgi:hypothetical protein
VPGRLEGKDGESRRFDRAVEPAAA